MDERDRVIGAKNQAIAEYDAKIQELETAIEQLSGKKVWEMSSQSLYDDESPDYIKSSIED